VWCVCDGGEGGGVIQGRGGAIVGAGVATAQLEASPRLARYNVCGGSIRKVPEVRINAWTQSTRHHLRSTPHQGVRTQESSCKSMCSAERFLPTAAEAPIHSEFHATQHTQHSTMAPAPAAPRLFALAAAAALLLVASAALATAHATSSPCANGVCLSAASLLPDAHHQVCGVAHAAGHAQPPPAQKQQLRLTKRPVLQRPFRRCAAGTATTTTTAAAQAGPGWHRLGRRLDLREPATGHCVRSHATFGHIESRQRAGVAAHDRAGECVALTRQRDVHWRGCASGGGAAAVAAARPGQAACMRAAGFRRTQTCCTTARPCNHTTTADWHA
jgi:hypothetical protein